MCINVNLDSRADSRSSVYDDDTVIVKVSVLQVIGLIVVLLKNTSNIHSIHHYVNHSVNKSLTIIQCLLVFLVNCTFVLYI